MTTIDYCHGFSVGGIVNSTMMVFAAELKVHVSVRVAKTYDL